MAGQGDLREVDRERVEPLSEYLTSLLATSRPMFSWASWVEPLMGVRITLSRPQRGEEPRCWTWAHREDVDGGAGEVAALDDVGQGVDVHHGAAGEALRRWRPVSSCEVALHR